MNWGLATITANLVEYALDGLALRHSAIAANIANANSAGYRPVRVSFENQIAGALAQSNGNTASNMAERHLPAPLVFSESPSADPTQRSSLDSEIVQLNRNVLQYQALIRGLDKYTSTIATAINEGKR